MSGKDDMSIGGLSATTGIGSLTDSEPKMEGVKSHAVAGGMSSPIATLAGVAATATIGILRIEIHEPLPAGHEFYAVVGQIASDWARIEAILDTIIWELAEIEPHRGACITAQLMGMRPRCLTILALGTYHGIPDEVLKSVKNFMHKSTQGSDDRNRVVHDPWFLEQSTQTAAQFRSMPKEQLVYGFVPRSKKELDETLAAIATVRERAARLKTDVLAAFQTSREKQGRSPPPSPSFDKMPNPPKNIKL